MTTRRTDKNHKLLKRPCSKCDEIFQPSTKFSMVCESCLVDIQDKANVKRVKTLMEKNALR